MPLKRLSTLLPVLLLALALCGCAGVRVSTVDTQNYMNQRGGDILTSGRLSLHTQAALQVLGLDARQCVANGAPCRQALAGAPGLRDEQRLGALAELWLHEASRKRPAKDEDEPDARLNAWLETARHAYAYLFFSERTPEMRALEDRQTQVRDYYNLAAQNAVSALYTHYETELRPPRFAGLVRAGGWNIRLAPDATGQPVVLPREIVPASALSFTGLRTVYRRDGLGAEMVAILPADAAPAETPVVSAPDMPHKNAAPAAPSAPGISAVPDAPDRDAPGPAWTTMPYQSLTAVLRFPGDRLEAVLAGHEAQLALYDPFAARTIRMGQTRLPLAGNFTSGYGLWLARSSFAGQALETLFGRGQVLEKPRVYLMQPYRPDRRTIIMLHGLASSPEAWINVANEIMGDETLGRYYQIWQVHYPTGAPLAVNNRDIRRALCAAFARLDPARAAVASREAVLIGHSMGGVLARLLVSSSGDTLWQETIRQYRLDAAEQAQLRDTVRPYLFFEPLPEIGRAIFIAAPHRGTPFADIWPARLIAGVIKLPAAVARRVSEAARLIAAPGAPSRAAARMLNGVDNLSSKDPFILAAATLPVAPGLPYHSILGNDTPKAPVSASSDGIVPYASAHLDGAASERVIPSGHSVQETPAAILEIRRILRLHLETLGTLEQGR